MTDIFFVPTPARVVPEMLKIAGVREGDVVMDLGSGDGQILIAAARDCGARGIGVEIDPALIATARELAHAAGVQDRLEFHQQDLFEADLRPATVLTLYLLDSINVRLRPRILQECRPGTRVVTYSFEMGEWQCDAHIPIAANGVSLWIVPANFSGEWQVDGSAEMSAPTHLNLQQRFQELSGTAVVAGERRKVITGRVRGNEFSLQIEGAAGPTTLAGRIKGEGLHAEWMNGDNASTPWKGSRQADTMTAL